jgi:hypothetical protein
MADSVPNPPKPNLRIRLPPLEPDEEILKTPLALSARLFKVIDETIYTALNWLLGSRSV